ncbi:hypothetical protein Ddye_006317 [Dipteronia dyeriana]|uniref:CTLH domain-containing protein n=1 Tax=Dipteronia dyeriana TaxID=168575 RepID=A0AAE0CQK0_9ROSI|nr:hypothetical protein Ddye_006317 [Dipteronia dyeriana]
MGVGKRLRGIFQVSPRSKTDNRYSTKIYFEMRKQNFLEALDSKDQEKALNILSKDLNVFANVDGGLFNEMTQLLTLEDIRQHESFANYRDTNSARRITMIELKRVIEANPIFHGKLNFPTMNGNRLQRLINQRMSYFFMFSHLKPHRTQLPVLVYRLRHPRSLPLPTPSYVKVKKISRLIYYNSGDGNLALGSNGVHLCWNWPTEDDLNQSDR